MIELLLQADKAVKAGYLDEAERLYWQAVEKDPRNSMAVAGLAQVALARGDQGTAHVFAAKALEVDPENLAAKRILDALEAGSEPAAAADRQTGHAPEEGAGQAAAPTPEPTTEDTARSEHAGSEPEQPPAQQPEARPVAPTKRRGLFRRVLGRD